MEWEAAPHPGGGGREGMVMKVQASLVARYEFEENDFSNSAIHQDNDN